MFHEAQEWKWVQTFHALMVATAVYAADWSFKNNLWLITLWPRRCTLRSPVRLFMRYPDICLAGVQSDNLWFVSILLKVALKVSGRTVGSSAVNPSLWDCTEGWEQRRGKDSSCFLFIFCQIYCVFGKEGGEQKPVRLAMTNIQRFVVFFK